MGRQMKKVNARGKCIPVEYDPKTNWINDSDSFINGNPPPTVRAFTASDSDFSDLDESVLIPPKQKRKSVFADKGETGLIPPKQKRKSVLADTYETIQKQKWKSVFAGTDGATPKNEKKNQITKIKPILIKKGEIVRAVQSIQSPDVDLDITIEDIILSSDEEL